MLNRKTPQILIAFLGLTSLGQAATIIEDFEGVTAPTLPGGWQVVGAGVTTAATGNPGNNLQVAAGSGYLVNSGTGFDANQDFSGTFDFWLDDAVNYSNIAFYVGDVQSSLGSSAGDHLRIDLRERTFGARANILDANGTTLFSGAGNNLYQIEDNQWYAATFSWIAATDTFSISWTGAQGNKGPMTVASYNFNSSEVFFGFGTASNAARFDNINITGTAIPEPSVAILSGLGFMLLLRRKKR